MWLGRSQGRHGREQKKRAERARRRSLREAAARRRGKSRGLLGLPAGEQPIFCCSCKRHFEKEPSAKEAGMWLRAYRPVLVACKARAKEQRMAERKHGKPSAGGGAAEGPSSLSSAGGGEPAEPELVDPDVDLLDIINSIP